MSDLLREVDEAVRADNMKRLWDEHKIAIVTAVTALILGTASFSIWKEIKLERNQEDTAKILTALESPKAVTALAETGRSEKGNARAIAFLNAAALELKAGNKNKALEAYKSAEESKRADHVFTDLARLQKTGLLLDLKPDTKAEEILKDLKPVAENKSSPWQAEAIFMTAFIKGEKNRDYAGAAKDLETLTKREDVTGSLKQRAAALQSVYDIKQEKK